MNEIIKFKLDKDFKKNEFEYFFTLLSERFDYLNNLWVKELEKKFNKKFKPIFILNAERNKFFRMDNYIIVNKRLYKLQKKLKNKKIIFQSESEDLNKEFCNSKFINSLINKLILKQERVFILSWTSSGLFLNNNKAIILGPDPSVATKYDNKIEQISLFKKLDLPANKTKIHKNFSSVKKISGEQYPFFLSASFSSGGFESRIIRSPQDLKDYFPRIRDINRNNKFFVAKLIQDIISSPNSSAMVIGRNKTEVLSVSDQILHGTKYLGNIYPAEISGKSRKIVIDVTKKIGNYLSRAGFRGLFGCDFLIDGKNNCYIIDLNPRRQGGYFCNVFMLQSKRINIIEAELKLVLGEKISLDNFRNISVNYIWAHSKIKPPAYSNYQISSILKSGEPNNPFFKVGSVFKMTFFPEKYLYAAGAAGYCIVSGNSRKKVKLKIDKIVKEVTAKCFRPNQKLPNDYFGSIEIFNFLK